MSLNIKSRSAVDAVRELAALTGESMTSAIEIAAREKIALLLAERRQGEPAWSDAVADDIRALQEMAQGSGMTRVRADEELYDDAGLLR